VGQIKKITSTLVAAGLGLLVSINVLAASDVDNAISERLKPVGEVCMAGTECASAPVAAAAAEPRSGSEVYASKCSICHASGAAGAPKMGDAAAWSPRIGKGLETLYSHALNGFKGMPAKGLCMDCSDDEVKQAVKHMVNGSK